VQLKRQGKSTPVKEERWMLKGRTPIRPRVSQETAKAVAESKNEACFQHCKQRLYDSEESNRQRIHHKSHSSITAHSSN